MGLSTPKTYISKQGMPYFETAGLNKATGYTLPRNLEKDKDYFGFTPKYNLNLSKHDLFEYLNLWENNNGIGVKGKKIDVVANNVNYVFRTKSLNQILLYNQKNIIYAGDYIVYKNKILYINEVYGEWNDLSELYTIDCKFQLLPLQQKDYEDFLAQDILITNQNLQNINLANAISTAINTALAGASIMITPPTPIPVSFPGLLGLPAVISAVNNENQILQEQIKEASLKQ